MPERILYALPPLPVRQGGRGRARGREGPTPEQYDAELDAWWQARKAERAEARR